ncbi:hypothetical protein [Gandjariella thermophila]|uniref:Uncharacterized protein n=1 Tax=Gandjariella thermophila TaxID=1931992 RepID=A0A4D4JF30_9PSEU|nr:hypothetical protein [Gandjariella thermophila]GDY32517.1 hypothetical protein GTS_41500 [Gandjariella thermophila]
MPTIVLILATVAVVFGVMKKHHHGWVAFAAVVLGIALMHSPLAGPADQIVNAFSSAGASLLHAIGLRPNG